MTAVEVHLHGERIGVLSHRSSLGDATEFAFDASWLAQRDRPDRPVLGQIFEEDLDRVWRSTHRVPEWFSNLLPEGPLRALLADRARVHPERELHLLAALGEDLPGAITVRAPGDLSTAPVAPAREAVDGEEALRFSLAGLQLKFGVDADDRGATVPVRGRGGRWIAKLPDPRFADVPENEHGMLSWAALAGIEVPEHRLVPVSRIDGLPDTVIGRTGNALLVRRFDRLPDGGSVHMEDLAQVRNVYPWEKYEKASFDQLGRVLYAACGPDVLDAYVDRLVFMVLSGNADLHLKNWTLLYADRRTPALAPAYDLVSTLVFAGTTRKLALKLMGDRSFHARDSRTRGFGSWRKYLPSLDVERLASRAEAMEARIRDVWPGVRDLLPGSQVEALTDHLDAVRF